MGLGKGPTSFFCMCMVFFPKTIGCKNYPSLNDLGIFVENHLTTYLRVYFWAVPLVHVSIFMLVPQCFHYCIFAVSFEIRKRESSGFVVLFVIVLSRHPLLFFRFHMNFKIFFFYFCRNTIGILIGITLAL